MRRAIGGLVAGVVLMAAMTGSSGHAAEDPAFASFAQQQAAMAAGQTSAERLVQAYLARISALDHAGPRLNSVIALNPHALADARALDAERKAGHVRGPLHGVVILLKDNIESADDTATTAGSLALKDNVTNRDAPLVKRLTDAGAVILGKTNLSEWANYRSTRSISGWSGVGGLVRNPHALDRSACGSSAGSGAAVAAALASAAIGTETDGSVTCPAAMNGIVGLKPTVGLVSRTHIIPISASQDTAGPMTRHVADAAALLTALAGSDPADPATADADQHKTDYLKALDPAALKGARIGVLRTTGGRSPDTDAVFERALAALKGAGATLVEVKAPDSAAMAAAEDLVLQVEFKAGINAYLASTSPDRVKTRTLADLIAFNAQSPRELALFGQEIFERSQAGPGLDDPAYLKAKADAKRLAGPEGIDRLLAEAKVEVLVAESGGPSSVVDPVNGSKWLGSASGLPAVAGYPHLTVPMGQVSGLPVGLSFIGPAWSEARLLSLGYAFEQATQARITPGFLPSVSASPVYEAAFAPVK
jgi:amidase